MSKIHTAMDRLAHFNKTVHQNFWLFKFGTQQ